MVKENKADARTMRGNYWVSLTGDTVDWLATNASSQSRCILAVIVGLKEDDFGTSEDSYTLIENDKSSIQ